MDKKRKYFGAVNFLSIKDQTYIMKLYDDGLFVAPKSIDQKTDPTNYIKVPEKIATTVGSEVLNYLNLTDYEYANLTNSVEFMNWLSKQKF